jgi:hypothetical protein
MHGVATTIADAIAWLIPGRNERIAKADKPPVTGSTLESDSRHLRAGLLAVQQP